MRDACSASTLGPITSFQGRNRGSIGLMNVTSRAVCARNALRLRSS